MADKRVSIIVDGKVQVDTSDLDNLRQDVRSINDELGDTIGNNREPSKDSRTWNNPKYAENRAERMLLDVKGALQRANTPGQLEGLLGRLGSAGFYAQESGNQELIDAIDELTDTLKTRVQNDENERTRQGFNYGKAFEQEGQQTVGRMITSATGGGAFGQVIAKGVQAVLGSGVLMAAGVAGAAAVGLKAVDSLITAKNERARDEALYMADLGRQYGYDNNMLGAFRDDSAATDPRFSQYGFTATQAAQAMATYNQPGTLEQSLADTERILRFSRATGMELGASAEGARAFNIAGADPRESLRVTELAIERGFKAGVAGSDTFQALLAYAKEQTAQGQAINTMALMAQASYLDNLNASGVGAFKGPMGASALNKMESSLTDKGIGTGEGFLLNRKILQGIESGSLNLDQLGFNSAFEQNGIKDLLARDPYSAADLIRQNMKNSPQAMQYIGGYIQDQFGGDPIMMKYWADLFGFSPQQTAAMIGGFGPGSILTDAGKYSEGEYTDPQGARQFIQDSLRIKVLEADRMVIDSLSWANATGGLQANLQELRTAVAQMGFGLFGQGILDESSGRGNMPDSYRPETWMQLRQSTPTPDGAVDPAFEGNRGYGAAAYGVMAGGLESQSTSDVNKRTGAFGASQIMPGNLYGITQVQATGILGGDWGKSFMETTAGDAWRPTLRMYGLDSNDPIPDDVAQAGGAAIREWRSGLTPDQQSVLDDFLRDVTTYQMDRYKDSVLLQGGTTDEAIRRSAAAWYGGPAWLNRTDSEYSLDPNNTNFTRRHGLDSNGDGIKDEPSIQEYIDKFMNGLGSNGKGEVIVRVELGGSANIITNLDPETKRRLENTIQGFANQLGEDLVGRDPTAVSGKSSGGARG